VSKKQARLALLIMSVPLFFAVNSGLALAGVPLVTRNILALPIGAAVGLGINRLLREYFW